MLRALADVNREAARRQQLVQAIGEVQVARVEAAWLREYEADPNRFKVSGVSVHHFGPLSPNDPAGQDRDVCVMHLGG